MSKSPAANIVDQSLVLSLPNAVNPVVWRMELAKAKMSAIEIREDKLGDYTLILKTPKGDSNEIARFPARKDALKGLNAITVAMQKAEKAELKANKVIDKKMSWIKAIAFGALAAILVVFAITLIMSVVSVMRGDVPTGLSGINSTSSAITQAQDGVPQSADDFLRR